jgi:DNA-binding GntR family transcriptional regulator
LTHEPISAIDRSSYEPAYAQLVRILQGQIAAGVFRPGDRLPSEARLCERSGVSPMTVRRVVNILASRGVVIAEQGRGTFVKPLELSTATFDLDSLHEHVIYDPTRPIIEAEMEVTALRGLFSGGGESDLKGGDLTIDATVLTEGEAALLHSEVGVPAFRLEHIFYDFDDRPVSWGWFICTANSLRFTATIGIPG